MLERSIPPLPRRDFLASAALGVAAGLTPRTALSCAAAPHASLPATVIDTHTHFYDPGRPEGVPWPDRDSFLYRRVLPADYRTLAEPLGITGTVVVEASPWVEDNAWLLELAEREPFIKGIVGHLVPGSEGFANNLQRFAANRLYRGIRVRGDLFTAESHRDAFRADVRRLMERDLELDVNGNAAILEPVASLAAALPDLRIVINHVAGPGDPRRKLPAAWRAGMAAAARHPNVYCKVSALVEQSPTPHGQAPTDLDTYRPILDHVWNEFGEDRVIFGTNWPVSDRGAPLDVVVRLVSEYFAEQGPAAVEKYFFKNAARAYQWVERTG